MADFDDKQIKVVAGQDDVPSLTSLNEVLRNIQMDIHTLAGRNGLISLRDAVDVDGNLTVAGKVGIGTKDPQADLHILNKPGAPSSTLRIGSDRPDHIGDGNLYAELKSHWVNGITLRGQGQINFEPNSISTPNTPALALDAFGTLISYAYDAWNVGNTGNESILNNTVTQVTFNSVIAPGYNHGQLYDTGTNVVTIDKPGLYIIGASIIWDAAAGGDRLARLDVNGAQAVVSQFPTSASNDAHSISIIRSLVAGDVVRVMVFQDSGAPLNVIGGVASTPRFWGQRLVGII